MLPDFFLTGGGLPQTGQNRVTYKTFAIFVVLKENIKTKRI